MDLRIRIIVGSEFLQSAFHSKDDAQLMFLSITPNRPKENSLHLD